MVIDESPITIIISTAGLEIFAAENVCSFTYYVTISRIKFSRIGIIV